MVSEGDCWRRAEANWALTQRFASDREFGWATTLAFYTALYVVNVLMVHEVAYADDMDHTKREAWLHNHHPAVESHYSAMLAKSKRTRYEVLFEADESFYLYQLKHLDWVRDYVRRFLAGQIPGLVP